MILLLLLVTAPVILMEAGASEEPVPTCKTFEAVIPARVKTVVLEEGKRIIVLFAVIVPELLVKVAVPELSASG